MTAIQQVTDRKGVVLYDGTNGTAIQGLFPSGNFVINSDNGTTLAFHYLGVSYTVTSGNYIVTANGGHVQAVYAAADVTDLLSFIQIPKASAIGVKPVPSILLNQSATVDVDLTRDMADTSYDAQAFLVGAVGSLTVTSADPLDVNTIRVVVQAGLAYVSGAQLVVVAHGAVA